MAAFASTSFAITALSSKAFSLDSVNPIVAKLISLNIARRGKVKKRALQVIRQVAKKQVKQLKTHQEEKVSEKQLLRAFKTADLQYRAEYEAILTHEREMLLNDEVQRLLRIQRRLRDDEDVLAFVLSLL